MGEGRRAGVALILSNGRGRNADRRRRAGGDREIVDAKAVVRTGPVEIAPADPDRASISQRKACDRPADRGAIGVEVAVQRPNRAGRDGSDEVEGVDVDPSACGEAGGIEAVLKIQSVDPRQRAEPPLLAEIRDREARDRLTGIVGQACSIVGVLDPLSSVPKARSVEAVTPKLYVSPDVPEPDPAV